MNNGWRDGLLVVWIISLLAAIGLWVSAIVIFGKGPDSAQLVPLAASPAGAAAAVSLWWLVLLLPRPAARPVVRAH